MEYFRNGAEIGELDAYRALARIAQNAGHEENELMTIWLARHESEEARELISELSDYEIELIPSWEA